MQGSSTNKNPASGDLVALSSCPSFRERRHEHLQGGHREERRLGPAPGRNGRTCALSLKPRRPESWPVAPQGEVRSTGLQPGALELADDVLDGAMVRRRGRAEDGLA